MISCAAPVALAGFSKVCVFRKDEAACPRRLTLLAAARESLLPLPDAKDDLIYHCTFSETDRSIIGNGAAGPTAWAKSATAVSSSSATGPAVSTW